ncbi:MAG: MarR family transcriptional regulator [Balneola sp.]|jgi:DNA-binding MarR family transcriptional regulator
MNELGLKLQFFIDLSIIQSKIKRKFDARLGINGVGLDDYIILHVLNKARNHQMERAELAKQVGISTTDLTRKLPKLEKIGLIERENSPVDIKKSKVIMTNNGRKVHGYATESAQEKAIDLLPFKMNKEMEVLIDTLNSLAKIK